LSGAHIEFRTNGTRDWIFGNASGDATSNFSFYSNSLAKILFSFNKTTGLALFNTPVRFASPVTSNIRLDTLTGANISYFTNGTRDWIVGDASGDATNNFSFYNSGTASIALSINKTTNALTLATKLQSSNIDTGRTSIAVVTGGALNKVRDSLQANIASINSGTFTPTLGAVTNITSVTARVCQFMQLGNTVTVSGYMTVTPTVGASSCRVSMTLPVASANFGNVGQAGGFGGVAGGANIQGPIYASVGEQKVWQDFLAIGTSAIDINFSYTYRIQ
jgi:hypothetical protein